MITQFYRERLHKNLPDAYSKAAGSNNAKILEIEKSAIDQLREAVSAVYDSLDIEKAAGKTLDLYGEMLGQARGMATDDQYRVLLKNRIALNFSSSDHTSIVNAICLAFGCDPSEVLLTEPDVCTAQLEGLPFAKLNENNIDINTAIRLVNSLMPAGVSMEVMNFAGTFEFGSTAMEYDEAAGFADEAQTIGGFFGLISDGTGSNLPV